MDPKSVERILSLASSFPSLRHFNAVPAGRWDAVALDKWAAHAASSGERIAAQFVLRVWNQYEEWECGRFDVVDALGTWDAEHWAAFAAWVNDPFTL